MKLRNAIFALGFAIAFTFSSFNLNASVDAPMGVIEVMMIEHNTNNLSMAITCDEAAQLTIIDANGMNVFSTKLMYSSVVNVNTRNWSKGDYIAILTEQDGTITTKKITF